jgi:hypothetical protein
MGGASSKEARQEHAIIDNEKRVAVTSTGTHFLEFHMPSAGFGFGSLVLLLVLMYLYWRCRAAQKKKEKKKEARSGLLATYSQPGRDMWQAHFDPRVQYAIRPPINDWRAPTQMDRFEEIVEVHPRPRALRVPYNAAHAAGAAAGGAAGQGDAARDAVAIAPVPALAR